MALSTYSDLQSAVASWLNRTDLTDKIPDFITLAESRLNRDLKLRVMEEEIALTLAQNTRSVALPTGFVEPIGLWTIYGQERRELLFLSPLQWDVETAAGDTFYWTIIGPNIEFLRPANAAQSLTFRFMKSFALSDAAPTNWLLTNHPDAYLFAALTEAAPYLKDTAALGIWDARASRAINDINAKEAKSRSLSMLMPDIPSLPIRNRLRGGYGTYG